MAPQPDREIPWHLLVSLGLLALLLLLVGVDCGWFKRKDE